MSQAIINSFLQIICDIELMQLHVNVVSMEYCNNRRANPGGGGGGSFVLNRVSNLSFFVLIRVSIYQFLS